MQTFVWGEEFYTGIGPVDEEHHGLVDLFNKLSACLLYTSCQIGAHLGVVRKDVADNVELLAASMRFTDRAAQHFQIPEIVVAYTQAVAWLAGIDRVGAKGKSRAHHGQRTGGCKQLGLRQSRGV